MAEITMTEALNKAIDEAMAEDDGVFCLGEDVAAKQGGGVFKVTSGLTEKYGENRIRATPISETAIIGAAVGAALAGQRPIAEIMLMNFVGVCMDQIVNHAAKLRFMSGGQTPCPIVIRTTTGVGVGFGGQHSDMLEAWFAHVAGMHVVTPSNAADARGLMRSAIDANDPVVFIENILCYGLKSEDPGPGYRVPLGKAAVPKEGNDISLITYGRTVLDALEVAGELEKEGISVEVVDLRTIAPYDEETVLASVNKTGRALTLHEAVRPFGTGAEIAANIRKSAGIASKVQFAGLAERSQLSRLRPILNRLGFRPRTRSSIRSRQAWARLKGQAKMAEEIRIPKLGMSATRIILTEWMFGDGEEVAKGDIIYMVETDKTTTEIEAQASGIIHPTGEEGAVYKVGELIGTIE